MNFKTFEGKIATLNLGNRTQDKAELRERARQFINQEVGAEQVVNVTETELDRLFSVTVWYRTAP